MRLRRTGKGAAVGWGSSGREGGREVPYLQRAISTKNRKKWVHTRKEGSFWRKTRGSLMLLPLRLRREVSGLRRRCENRQDFDFLLE